MKEMEKHIENGIEKNLKTSVRITAAILGPMVKEFEGPAKFYWHNMKDRARARALRRRKW